MAFRTEWLEGHPVLVSSQRSIARSSQVAGIRKPTVCDFLRHRSAHAIGAKRSTWLSSSVVFDVRWRCAADTQRIHPSPTCAMPSHGGTNCISTCKAPDIWYIHTIQTCTYACLAHEDRMLRFLSCFVVTFRAASCILRQLKHATEDIFERKLYQLQWECACSVSARHNTRGTGSRRGAKGLRRGDALHEDATGDGAKTCGARTLSGATPSPTHRSAAKNHKCTQWRYPCPFSSPTVERWSIVEWVGPSHAPAHTNASASPVDPPPPPPPYPEPLPPIPPDPEGKEERVAPCCRRCCEGLCRLAQARGPPKEHASRRGGHHVC